MATLDSVELAELEQRISDRTAELEAINEKLANEIAERRRTEKQLRLQAQLLDSVRESVVATDLEGRVTYWSKGAETLYGYRAEEVVGRSITFIVGPQEQREEEQRMLAVYDTGSWSGCYVQRRKDGSTFCADTFISLVTDEHGRPTGFIGIDRDATERKQAEEALRESKARLTLAQEAANIGTGDWDIESDTVYWSDHQFRLHGLAPTVDHMISLEAWLALVHPDDRVRSVDVINTAIKNGEGFSVEYRVIGPDDQVRWLCGTARVVRDHNGRAVRMIGVSIDITERKRAEEALRESEERFALAAQGSNDGLWYSPDVSKDAEWWSARLYELLGYEEHEIQASLLTIRALLHPDDRARNKELIRAHLEKRVPYDMEYRLKTKSGEYRWYRCRAQAVWDERGNPSKMAGSLRDITERKQAEEALRKSEERFALAAQGSSDAMWDWPNVNENDQWWSPRWYELTGYTTNEIQPTRSNFIALMHPDDVPRAEQTLRQHFVEHTPYDIEYRLRTKSGQYRWYQSRGQAFWDEDGKPARMAGSFRDITERKRAEETLRRFERMVSTSSDLMAFVDKTYTYLAANTAYAEALGKTKEEVIGKRVPDVLGRAVFNSPIKSYLDQCLSGKHVNYQYWLNLSGRASRYLDVRYDPYRDASDSVSGVVVGIRDITEDKKVQEALRESEVRYRSIVENAPLCIHEIDTNGRLISMNAAGLQMMGLESQNDVSGMPYLDAVCGEDRGRVAQLLKRALTGEPATFDFSADTKLGKRAFTSSFNPIRTTDGVIDEIMGMTQDITERKRAENQILASHQRLRNLATQLQAVREEERTIIAREVHDELGQAMTALKMDLAWIAKSLPNRWKAIPDRVHSMISLTDSTLATVRQLSSRLRPAILDDLGLEAAIEWQAHEFVNRGDYECQLDLKAPAIAPNKKRDTAIFRIFQEALTNIARHASANRISVKLRVGDEELLLVVKDNGKGISDDALASPYSLGLTGMYERARTLGGSLKIERGTKDKGTVLTLSSPLTSTKRLAQA